MLLSSAPQAHATDLGSSTTGYSLSPNGNPYTVVAGATIDTRASGNDGIAGEHGTTWTLTNNGNVYAGSFALEFGDPATVLNNGIFFSPVTTALALFGGASVTNSAGAVIAGKLDGIYAASSTSVVVNAGTIAGDILGLADTQSGIHLPKGGTVNNLATGTIAGSESAILAAPGTTITNAGVIVSASGPAIDLTAGSSSTGGVIVNSGTITGNGGVAIEFGPNGSTLQLTGTSIISGIVEGGSHSALATNTLILGGTDAGSFDLSAIGATAQYRDFDTLLKADAGVWTMTGANGSNQAWQMSGGGLVIAGQLLGSISAVPGSTGLTIDVAAGGSIQASGASAVSLDSASVVVNNGSITSSQGPALTAGSNVSVTNAGTLSGNGVALRFTGSNDSLTLDTGSVVSGALDGGGGTGNMLILQGSGNLSSAVDGFPALVMRGTDWTLAGTTTIDTSTTIETGTLHENGTLTSPAVTVAPGATLSGTGTVKGALVTQGTIAPGTSAPSFGAAGLGTAGLGMASLGAASSGTSLLAPLSTGTLSVLGSYTQAAGSRYEVGVTPGGNDLIDINGTATLQGGNVLAQLRAASFKPSDSYLILTASAGVSGTYAGVSTLNPFVSASLAYDANNVWLAVQRGFQNAGGTPNQIAVEKALDHGIAGLASNAAPSGDFLRIAVDLVNLEGASAYAALDQLSAEAYAALPNAHFAAAQSEMNAIDARLTDARGTLSCADAQSGPETLAGQQARASANGDPRVCSWAAVLGNTGRIDGYDTWLTQQIDLAGAIAGVDYRIAPPLTVGAAIGYMHGNTSTDTLPVHGQFDSYQALLYGSYAPEPYWLQTMLGIARNDDTMKRSILFTDTPRTAQGDTTGNQYFASLRTGVDLPGGAFGVIAPFAGLQAQYVELSGLTETGAGSVDLTLPGLSASSVSSLLGAQWRKAYHWMGRTWHVDMEAAWVHTYGALTRAIDARFTGAPAGGFTVHGSGPARDAAQLSVGTRVELTRRAFAFVHCEGELGAHESTLAGTVGLDYRW
jgi:uncharacterized protein with beta-barrel porin domain